MASMDYLTTGILTSRIEGLNYVIIRPYGFTYGGYGSAGYGYLRTYISSPNIYGGYYNH